jgi:hypothetical protein
MTGHQSKNWKEETLRQDLPRETIDVRSSRLSITGDCVAASPTFRLKPTLEAPPTRNVTIELISPSTQY